MLILFLFLCCSDLVLLQPLVTVQDRLPPVLVTASGLFCLLFFLCCSILVFLLLLRCIIVCLLFLLLLLFSLFPVLLPFVPVLLPLFPVLLPLLFCFRLSSAISYCLGSFAFSSCFCPSLDIPQFVCFKGEFCFCSLLLSCFFAL